MVQQLYSEIEKLKAEIRRLRGQMQSIMSGGQIIPTSIISTGGSGSSGTGFLKFLNSSGSTMLKGTIVHIDTATAQTMIPSPGALDSHVIGVLTEDTLDGAYGFVRHIGWQDTVFVTGSVNAGEYLQSSDTPGVAESTGINIGNPPFTYIFAVATSNYTPPTLGDVGSVSAWIFPIFTDRLFQYTDSLEADVRGLFLLESADMTISSGEIDITAVTPSSPWTSDFGDWSTSNVRVDTEASAASDDLDTITCWNYMGQVLIVHPVDDARTVVIKHNTGNILCVGNADITLDDQHDFAILVFDSVLGKWMAR